MLSLPSKNFKLEGVYYSEEMIFICLAFLSLLRVKNINQANTIPCGELGREMGLDRIPEVKTLRERIDRFTQKGNVQQWSSKLSGGWMSAKAGVEGVLYIDGHVNIYYGHGTHMPLRFVSRLRLCMSGSTDYCLPDYFIQAGVNDKTGQPFFEVSEAINSGMIAQIKTSILPRLEKEVPDQPSAEALQQNPQLHRFMIVCDRESYSVDFLHYLWQKLVGICIYNKNVKDKWPEEDFIEYEMVDQEDGTMEKIKLAEKKITLTNNDKENPKEITCREIRKLSKSGHQTSILTTNWALTIIGIGFYMFARWCQENFFKYMAANRKIPFASLPEDEKFTNAINVRKQFMDNIKMITYKAETAMYNMIKNQLGHPDEGRQLLQKIYTSDADIIPDYTNKSLTVKLHNLNYHKDDKAVQYLCENLNETVTTYPGTDLKIIYQLVSS